MKSKTIIVSNQNTNGRGILTITDDNDILKCKLRLYNVPRLSASCRLGLYHNNEVYTANLINRGSFYESSFAGIFDMTLDFYSAIIDTSNNNEVIVAGGTYAGYFYEDNSIFTEAEKEDSIDKPTIDINTPDPITTVTPNDCSACDRCAKCKYKEYFYSQNTPNNVDITTSEPKEETELVSEPLIIKQPKTASILDSIVPQFKYIFEHYAPNEELNRLINNGKFVAIKEDKEEYSIGAIYDGEDLTYICYAVRCNYNSPAPQELGKYHQWLPLDPNDPLSEGYYIVYQDAHDLKIVEL